MRCLGPNFRPFSSHRTSIHPTAHCDVRIVVDVAQRAEREIGLWAGKIVELAARGFRQHPDGVAAIKREHLGARIAEPLGGDQAESRGLAGAGRSDDQRVAQVGDMKVEPERSRTAGCCEQQAAGCSSASVADGILAKPAHTDVIGSMSARFSVCSRIRRTFE